MPSIDNRVQEAYATLAQSTKDQEWSRTSLNGDDTLNERFSLFFELAARSIENGDAHTDGTTVAVPTTAEDAAKYIDHTLLKLDATEQQVDKLCNEAKEYSFKVLEHADSTRIVLTVPNRLFVFV